MQNMHPGLGAGVEEHSEFFEERWERLLRSLYPIGGVVFDGDRAQMTAEQVPDYHRNVKGIDSSGRRYHALDPDTFYWAHATFFMGTILVGEHFAGGLTEAQKRQLFEEHIQWYALYGMSMRPVPESWEAFQAYWDHMCREVLEVNKATTDVLDVSELPKPPSWRWMPDFVWAIIRPAIARQQMWMTTGMYDQPVRDLLGRTWTARDERMFRLVGRTIHHAYKFVPARHRKHPRARAGLDRVSGRTAADSPLVETPARNLPPMEHRGDPKHYAPTENLGAMPRLQASREAPS